MRGVPLDMVAQASGTSWVTTMTASAGANLEPGDYAWAAVVSQGDERITVRRGSLTVLQNLAKLYRASEVTTPARKALDACDAALASFSASGGRVNEYEIAGRKMKFATIGELIQLRNFWAVRVMSEAGAQSAASGAGNPRNLYVRFRRP